MDKIYLDYAAATPMDAQVVEAMAPYHVAEFYNPSALYCAAKAVRQQLEASRGAVAEVIGVKAADIIFTAGGRKPIIWQFWGWRSHFQEVIL